VELQAALPFDRPKASRRGGKRDGAGRKPNGARAGRPHVRRPRIHGLVPVHVTLRVASHVYNLRSRRSFRVIRKAINIAAERFGVRIIEFSVQGNHMHFVVEAAAHEALSRAMQGFSIRLAKGLNAMMNRRGRVFADRYHARALGSRYDARRVVRYVRDNFRRHMAKIGKLLPLTFVDPFASPRVDVELPAARSAFLRITTGPPS
jgi:REP element-mobilizing transposase RayT